jgi:hypothetical protein
MGGGEQPARGGYSGDAPVHGGGDGGAAGAATGLDGAAGMGEPTDQGGAAGTSSCQPLPPCGLGEPQCADDFLAACREEGYAYCCDSERGVVQQCDTAVSPPRLLSEAFVVENSCSHRSFGTLPCHSCLIAADLPCGGFGDCDEVEFCSDWVLGYRARCSAQGWERIISIECVCDLSL